MFSVCLYVKPLFATLFRLFKYFMWYFPKVLLKDTMKDNHQQQKIDFIVIVLLFDRS